jgi:hypothetical protein
MRSGPAARAGAALDHKHRLKGVRPYKYMDTETLLADFWSAVEEVLRENGVIR